MTDSVICKMQCHAVAVGEEELIDGRAQTVCLGAVYEPLMTDAEKEQPENAVYGKYTPYGDLRIGIGPLAAKQFFEPGKKYYITITRAPD